MNTSRKYNILLAPINSEKNDRNADKQRTIGFKVALNASKLEIKKAVEALFKVKVINVNTVRQKGKVCRFRNHEGKHSDWKKAYVKLAEGNDINFANI